MGTIPGQRLRKARHQPAAGPALTARHPPTAHDTAALVQFAIIYCWQAGAMAVARLAMLAEGRPGGWILSRALLYICGFGSLMTAITLTSYVKELTGAESRWDKTEKSGKVVSRA
jgi:membrane-associated PAP2 superfamily phosphatase